MEKGGTEDDRVHEHVANVKADPHVAEQVGKDHKQAKEQGRVGHGRVRLEQRHHAHEDREGEHGMVPNQNV